MKTTNIYRVVIVESNNEAIARGTFCLTTESLNVAITKEIEDYEKMGYTSEDYNLHKWAERHMAEGWRTVTHIKTLTKVTEWGIQKMHIGYTTYQAQ